MDLALISVVVPVYKTEKYLTRCVDSILAQSYENIEIILVDDGSPDGCPKLCDELAATHTNIRVIHKENGGLSSARNSGIEQARGEYLAFVDSDDFIEKDMLKRLHQMLTANGADLAMVDYEEVTEEKKGDEIVACEELVYTGKDTEKAFLFHRIESVCVGLYTREAIGEYRFPIGKTSEDVPFNFAVFQKINRFVYAPEKRYYYFYNTQSISNGCFTQSKLNYLYFREEIYEHYKAAGDEELTSLAEVLYARSAMALMSRIALFGIAEGLDEKAYRKQLKDILKAHKKSFFRAKDVPISRKVMGWCCLHAFWLLKLVGRIKR